MSPAGAVVRATPGDYHGRPTMQIANGLIQVDVLAGGVAC